MNGYLIIRASGELPSDIIRADNANRARELAEGAVHQLIEIRADVATTMGVPEEEGLHQGAFARWEAGPADIFGRLLPIT